MAMHGLHDSNKLQMIGIPPPNIVLNLRDVDIKHPVKLRHQNLSKIVTRA